MENKNSRVAEVGQRILQFITHQGLTPNTVASALGISSKTMNRAVNGEIISTEVISRLLTAHPQLREDWVLFGSGPMTNRTSNLLSEADNLIKEAREKSQPATGDTDTDKAQRAEELADLATQLHALHYRLLLQVTKAQFKYLKGKEQWL